MGKDSLIESKLRNIGREKLQALGLFLSKSIITSSTIQAATQTADSDLAGILSSLSRIKNENEEPLILLVGRDETGSKCWKLNEKLISKERLYELLDEMSIEELKKYEIQK